MLDVDVRRRLGDLQIRAQLVSAGGLTVLFGRSGAGKTSVINMIGGLLRPDAGRIAVDGQLLFDSEAGLDLPVHRRRIGYVFQEGRLFPHLTVRRNLLYGRRFAPPSERGDGFDQVTELLGLGHLLDRRPGLLSGGEKQRVAIGRALLAAPRLLLMDEPLASLDVARKEEILPYIERLRDESRIPIIYVSHSLPEVTRLATTMVLMSDGATIASGPVEQIMSRLDLHPMTGRYEAGSVIDAEVAGEDAEYALTRLAFAGGELRVPRLDLPPGSEVRVRVRARDVVIATEPPRGLSTLNVLRGTVAEIEPGEGAIVDLSLQLEGALLRARVTRKSLVELDLRPGRPVYALIKSIAFDRRSIGRGGHGQTAGEIELEV